MKSKKARKVSEYTGRKTPNGGVERSVKQSSVSKDCNSTLINPLTGDLMNNRRGTSLSHGACYINIIGVLIPMGFKSASTISKVLMQVFSGRVR